MSTRDTISKTINNQIIHLDKILPKMVKDLTFKEVICLIFYSIDTMSKDSMNLQQREWKIIYDEFEADIQKQNNYNWPKIKIITNNENKRIDVFAVSKMYIKSDNFLTHLFRLLSIENYKRAYNYKSYGYHKILNHKLDNNNTTTVKYISLYEIFNLFKIFMEYYISIYGDKDLLTTTRSINKSYEYQNQNQNQKRLEYLLAKTIIKKL